MEDKKNQPVQNKIENNDTLIYKLNSINETNKLIIKLYGMLKDDKKMNDENIRSFEIDGFKCDIMEKLFTSDELIRNKKIPFLYATIYYSKGSINMEILKYVLFFNANNEINENSLNIEIDGIYTLEVFLDNESILLKEYDKFSKKKKIVEDMIEMITIKKNKQMFANIFKNKIEKMLGINDFDNKIPEPSITIEN